MELAEAMFKCGEKDAIYRVSKSYNMYWNDNSTSLIEQIASRDVGSLHANDWRIFNSKGEK
jgi:hypothetical protein